ncbi:hypothetical protein HNQ60_003873 [Povalibacter uvarum]|uniref:Uncharacterized protein n=1 Tax=Povalibacter uvarum TaxID=732238 RepID=A0A841HQ42_9GAMM|nr:hypothetical protein [Povalibacter uvarum]
MRQDAGHQMQGSYKALRIELAREEIAQMQAILARY